MAKAAPKGGPVSWLEDAPIMRGRKANCKMANHKYTCSDAENRVLEAVSALLDGVGRQMVPTHLGLIAKVLQVAELPEATVKLWDEFFNAAFAADQANWRPEDYEDEVATDPDGRGDYLYHKAKDDALTGHA